ncbi:MAG: SCO family protein [Solirubrobacteraceae bacterium]
MSTSLGDAGEPNPSEHEEAPGPPAPARRGGLNPRVFGVLLVVILIAGGVALLTTGGNGSQSPAGSVSAKRSAFDAAGLLSPSRPAPPIALRNYLGQPVNIDTYRGKVVLVTFLYTNCPDICPLITSQLRVAQNLMSQATRSKLQIIAVSVDPKGDTPKAVAAFLARHGMTGRMQYLIGSAQELARVWKAWGVGSEQDASQPQFVNHSGIVYGITASGKQLTVYSPEFKPAAIAHDVPILASL